MRQGQAETKKEMHDFLDTHINKEKTAIKSFHEAAQKNASALGTSFVDKLKDIFANPIASLKSFCASLINKTSAAPRPSPKQEEMTTTGFIDKVKNVAEQKVNNAETTYNDKASPTRR